MAQSTHSFSIGNIIADSLNLSLGYAERLLEGIEDDQFGRLAQVQGQAIESNHPAFLLGHLSLYAHRVVGELGGDPIALPEGFNTVFSKDASCVDDPEQSIYPSKSAITVAFFQGYRQAMEELRAAKDATFAAPNPGPARLQALFPTLGSMHAFYCGGHMMLHLGQLSAWRRAMGLGPA